MSERESARANLFREREDLGRALGRLEGKLDALMVVRDDDVVVHPFVREALKGQLGPSLSSRAGVLSTFADWHAEAARWNRGNRKSPRRHERRAPAAP